MLKLHPAPAAIGEASVNVQLSRNESDDQLVKRFMKAFAEWERNSPHYWGGSMFLRPGGLSATLKKYGPIDQKSESELKPFYDLQTLYSDPAKVTINLVKGCGKIKWTKSVSWVSIFQLVQIIISLALCYSLIIAITRNGNEKITFCHIC